MASDGLKPFAIERFGGINLTEDPEEQGAVNAIDLKNVDFDRHGRVRQRDGLTRVVTAANAANGNPVKLLPFYGSNQLMMADTGRVYAYDNSWSEVANVLTTGNAYPDMAVVGNASGSQAVYIADLGVGIRKWNGAAFSTVGGTTPQPNCLAVTKPSNRLVAGYTGTASTDLSKVWFSSATNPETWGTNDYVLLNPGDGEYITALVQWRDLLFAFKQTKFYVFYGESTSAAGDPEFNYRPVDMGQGTNAFFNACAGREGVYFLNDEGVWLTTGGPPVKISQALDPLFAGIVPAGWSAGGISRLSATATFFHRISYASGRLFVTLNMSSSSTFVYDPQTRQWTMWISGQGMGVAATYAQYPGSGAVSSPKRVYVAGGTANPKIFYLNPSATTDDGTAIQSYYQSGFFDLGRPGSEKTVRDSILVGTGTVNVKWAKDFASVASTSSADVTLGSSPAIGRGTHRNGLSGELLSFRLASVSGGAWVVNRLVPGVREVRGFGERTS